MHADDLEQLVPLYTMCIDSANASLKLMNEQMKGIKTKLSVTRDINSLSQTLNEMSSLLAVAASLNQFFTDLIDTSASIAKKTASGVNAVFDTYATGLAFYAEIDVLAPLVILEQTLSTLHPDPTWLFNNQPPFEA
jgi:uncharacterized phage infection (PIP) family protein YhgE